MAGDTPHKGFKLTRLHVVAIIAVVIAAAIISLAYFTTTGFASSATVVAGDNVSVYYTGSFTNGTVFSTNVGQQPLNFTAGSDELIEGFSQGVIGMKVGQNRTITVPPSEGYGEVNQSLIISVPISEFVNVTLYNGLVVTNSDGQEATIIAFNATNATVDFNPPLVGYTLVFNVTLVAVRK